MGYSNGKITAPISIADVKTALGAASNDLGTLCTHGNINQWSKHKPVNEDSFSSNNEGAGHVKNNNGTDYDGYKYLYDRYGIRKPWLILPARGKICNTTTTTALKTDGTPMYVEFGGSASQMYMSGWQYQKIGMANADCYNRKIYRLTDFKDYVQVSRKRDYINNESPVQPYANIYWNGISGQFQGTIGVIYDKTEDGESLSLHDLFGRYNDFNDPVVFGLMIVNDTYLSQSSTNKAIVLMKEFSYSESYNFAFTVDKTIKELVGTNQSRERVAWIPFFGRKATDGRFYIVSAMHQARNLYLGNAGQGNFERPATIGFISVTIATSYLSTRVSGATIRSGNAGSVFVAIIMVKKNNAYGEPLAAATADDVSEMNGSYNANEIRSKTFNTEYEQYSGSAPSNMYIEAVVTLGTKSETWAGTAPYNSQTVTLSKKS